MNRALLLLLVLAATINANAEDELHPVAREVIRKTITEEGKWGLIQPNAKSRKAGVWAWVAEAPVKLFEFDLELPPQQCTPEVQRSELDWEKHKEVFPDLKEKPEGEKLWVYTMEQSHVTSVTPGGNIKIVQSHVHAHACIYNMATGNVICRSSRKFYRLSAYNKKQQKKEKPEC